MGGIRLQETRAASHREILTVLSAGKDLDPYTIELITQFEEGWLSQAQLMELCPGLFDPSGADLTTASNVKFIR